jgi:DNA-binding protein Fis
MSNSSVQMENSRNECLECVRLNIKSIRSYIKDLNYFQVSNLYQEVKDILYLYGFEKKDVQQLLKYSGTYEEYDDEQLLEMQGVTNAILFHLKYK